MPIRQRRQKRMQQLLDQKQQPRAVLFRIVENIFLPDRLVRRAGLKRRPEIAGSHAVEAMRFFAEALAQPARRQSEQAADGFYSELEKRIAEISVEIQTVERDFLCPLLLF